MIFVEMHGFLLCFTRPTYFLTSPRHAKDLALCVKIHTTEFLSRAGKKNFLVLCPTGPAAGTPPVRGGFPVVSARCRSRRQQTL